MERKIMVIILLANGFEELEALSPLDILMRAGYEVKTVGISGEYATGTHGITVKCDLSPDEVDLKSVDLAIFPGGMPGTLNLDASVFTNEVISSVTSRGCMLAAICAAPLILGRRGLLSGKRAICFPGFENELTGAIISSRGVETDGLITTAKDYAHAFEFGHTLAKEIKLFRGEN
jgi:4-methyl-5(b-hydroxyethyl)-thiazole monophosphate biosynthesis